MLATTKDGRLLTWGLNNKGQCGHGSGAYQQPIRQVDIPWGRVVDAVGGFQHSYALSCL